MSECLTRLRCGLARLRVCFWPHGLSRYVLLLLLVSSLAECEISGARNRPLVYRRTVHMAKIDSRGRRGSVLSSEKFDHCLV